MATIQKILIANRGEIAIRVMKTCRDMGITSVAVYSDADKNALFVKYADEAVGIGGLQASESYLNQDKIIHAAKLSGADAIHPGYGFLSENPSFVKRCEHEGIVFIGPSADAVEKMGSKSEAKKIVSKAGVPVVPGYNGDDQSLKTITAECKKIGYPVLIKAAAGGGGKGMRIVTEEKELAHALEAAKREAKSSFGDDTVLIEKYFASAKHIEFQIFGDKHGNHTHFFERECSAQRRYQKVVEESPSPSLSAKQREEMGSMAIAVAESINYYNAGTVEFILSPDGNFYFLEVNARLQVEHPITEEVTGIDLVKLQIEIAQGQKLPYNQKNITQKGHAIECRICAEDPENNFFPAIGNILKWRAAKLHGVRYDSGVDTNSTVDIYYDSMLAKVIVKADTRNEAIQKMSAALSKLVILGVTTNIHFLNKILHHPLFLNGTYDTNFIANHLKDYNHFFENNRVVLHDISVAATLYKWAQRKENNVFSHLPNGWRNNFYKGINNTILINGNSVQVEYYCENNTIIHLSINGEKLVAELAEVHDNHFTCVINNQRKTFVIAQRQNDIFIYHPVAGNIKVTEEETFKVAEQEENKGAYKAPMPGEIVKILVKEGDTINSGTPLLIMSSMKMETTIEAHSEGTIEEIFMAEKSFVEADTVLIKMSPKLK